MSLQDAADYFNRRRNSPVERGISAGQAAYEGERAPAPQRSGIGPVPIADVKSSVQQAIEQAAAQRQVLADTAQKQALGLYPNTGTSAAAYNYLRGAPGAKYPVNPVLAGQPGSALTSPTISKPYEGVNPVGGKTQSDIAKAGDQKPPISRAGYGPGQMPQPGLLDSLLGMALPAYLGYKGYQYLSGLGGATNWANPANWSNVGLSGLDYGGGVIAPTVAPVNASEVQAILDRAYSTSGVDVASAGAGGPEFLPGGGGEAGATTTAGAAASNLPALDAGAGQVGYVWDGTNMVPATADQIAAASADGVWAGTAADVAAGETAANAALAAGEASSLSALAPYAPWIAVAAMTPAGQQAVKSVGDLAQNVVSGLENAGQNLVNTVQNWGSSLGQATGLWSARGGLIEEKKMAMGGLSAAADHYNLGGYSDGGRLLKGPGDGVSDSIPATIGKNRQPARLADGEFVVPARIVSELGNGSTEAGARKLYAMMDRIQNARKKSVGKGKVAVNSRADKNLPA